MVAQKLISAERMGKAVLFDPQFAMPQRPRFPRDLAVIPLRDGLLIDGAADQQVFRGKATKTLLPRLLPLLDGQHRLPEIMQALPDISPQSAYNMVALLYTRGLLEDSAADPDTLNAGGVNPQVLAYFRRHVDTTRVNHSALQSLARLTHSQVAVMVQAADAQTLSADICTQLRNTGIGNVLPLAWGDDLQVLFAQPADYRLIIALVDGRENQEHLRELDDQCARHHIPWLRAAINTRQQVGELGPYFERGETACYRCFARACPEPQVQEDRVTDMSLDEKLAVRLWAEMLVLETIYLLSRIAPPSTGIHMTRYALADWTNQRIDYPKLPGCPICRPAPVEMGYIEPAVVYEDSVAFASRHLIDPKDHQVHYKASNMELAHEGKYYPSNLRVALPRGEQLAGATGTTLEHLPGRRQMRQSAHTLDIAALATLLLKSAGIRHGGEDKTSKLQRWSPTGGNLGSVELYVAAFNVQGLAPGIYCYQMHEHSLAHLRSISPEEYTEFLCHDLRVEAGMQPDALIFAVAAYHRVAHKYSTFAYRVINLDAGVAISQLHMVAHYLGISAQTVPAWADDMIANWLDLEDIQEMVTAVVALQGATERQQEEQAQ